MGRPKKESAQPQASTIGIPDSPYLTVEEGARLLRFDVCAKPVEAFRKFLRRNAIPVRRAGRKLLIERRVLEAIVREN